MEEGRAGRELNPHLERKVIRRSIRHLVTGFRLE